MSVIDVIKHYQRSIEKYSGDKKRVLHCIGKLDNLSIKVNHLQETGVGRTVNSLRKDDGEVGHAARTLVSKWKEMVAADSSNSEADDNSDGEQMQIDEQNGHNETDQPHESDHENEYNEYEDEKYKKSNDAIVNKCVDKEKSHSKRFAVESNHNESSKKNTKYETNEKRDKSSEKDEYKKHKKKTHSKKHTHREKSIERSDKSHKSDKHKKSHSSKHDHKMKVKDETKNQIDVVESKHSKHKKHKSSKEHEHSSTKHKRSDKDDSSTNKRKLVDVDILTVNKDASSDEEGINSFSGTSFAEALGMVSPSKKKSKGGNSTPALKVSTVKTANSTTSSTINQESTSKPDLLAPTIKLPELNLDLNLPTITPNYQPLSSTDAMWSSLNKISKHNEEEALSIVISSKNQRTKVYSGNKTAYGYVPSLFELCIRILQDNIDALAYTGGVPYSILLPVLERATPEQLFTLEHYNPYLLEDTDVLWEQHCKREFRSKRRNELESWREAYSRFLMEREEKLKALTANIKQSIDKSLPVRQTKLAYVDSVVKPPRGVARKQAKFGTASGSSAKPAMTPASRVAALANTTTNISVPNPGAKAVSHSSSSISKPKKAPLMQKTLALIKSTNRYRR